MTIKKIPIPDQQTSLLSLKAIIRERHPLAALQVFHEHLGDIFQIQLPGFKPVMMAGPEAAHFVLVEQRDELRWRNENDPVTQLLRHGVLVEDGEEHSELRRLLNPALHRRMLNQYVREMWGCVQLVTQSWPEDGVVDMLVEMRKIALLILMSTLYRVDFYPQLKPLWDVILGCIRYISPGMWMIWSGVPRPGFRKAIQTMDEYLLRIIAERRSIISSESLPPEDLLGILIDSGMEDGLIRDQLLTMLIAGHDTVTALMAWTFYLLGTHPPVMKRVREEAAAIETKSFPELEIINRLEYLGQVLRESLRLYPPIHLGSRLAAADLDYMGYRIPKGTRVVYSIYLTQRHPDYWPDPNRFDPDRHSPGAKKTPYAWLAFGGGPRNCIGAAFGQMEASLVIASILRQYRLELVEQHVHPHMGATLEPHPGVKMRVKKFSSD